MFLDVLLLLLALAGVLQIMMHHYRSSSFLRFSLTGLYFPTQLHMALPFALHNLLHSAYLKSTNIGKTCLNAPISLGRATAIAFLIELKGKNPKKIVRHTMW